ncbi:type II toxin-antitoxin system RelB/DinJ family antitoxin [bacterium]|nr:type II toxin-antitoxin system RelB/DinJ family antitoxin [bacterium]
MAKTETIRARIEPDLKHEVDDILSKLGLNATTAINIFYHQVKLKKGLPFDVNIPNDVTLKTLHDSDEGKNLVHCEDKDDLFDKLEL